MNLYVGDVKGMRERFDSRIDVNICDERTR